MKQLFILLFISGVVFSTQAQEQQFDSEIDLIFSDWNQPDVPGGAVGVIQNGKIDGFRLNAGRVTNLKFKKIQK